MAERIDAWQAALERHEGELGELEDIEGPSKIPLDNLAIQILGSMLVGNGVLVRLGELLAEYHRYQWHAETVKAGRATGPRRSADEAVAELFGVYSHVAQVHRAWRAYVDASERGHRRIGAARTEHAAFTAALEAAVVFVRQVNGSGPTAAPTSPESPGVVRPAVDGEGGSARG
ncbi:hypothetical protein AB0K52_09510 [Glycomyces sp. NPDC049804]|uniref:hypothetical protein n=1 Tax=Glycomyces sp. NPDC049804 TaxID=3154363 RepID=UPI003432E3BB